MKKRYPDYYQVTQNGYACVICGQLYRERFTARNCCKDKKPASQQSAREAEHILLGKYHRLTPRTAQPGDGILHKDRWGHWHRGKNHTPQKSRADYERAFKNLEAQHKQAQVERLEKLFPSITIEDFERSPKARSRTPLQRLAWAYINHNWEAVRKAAIEMASEAAISSEVEQWKQELTLDEINIQELLDAAERQIKKERED
ncbi:hypothetical protein KKF61_06950 [Patescibacteria group bacterium]|nr:hypothetical protein [Patescibacteria group bacterium]